MGDSGPVDRVLATERKLRPLVVVGVVMLVLSAVSVVWVVVVFVRAGVGGLVALWSNPAYAGVAWALPVVIVAMAGAGSYLVARRRVGWFVYVCEAVMAAFAAWFGSIAILATVLMLVGATIYLNKRER